MDFTGQRVTVVGLARSGAAAARWLLDRGAAVVVTDARNMPETRAAAEALRIYGALRQLTIELGAHTPPSVRGSRLVVTSPGVPETAPVLRWAEEDGIPVISEVELAARHCPGSIVAVTGTNGKTTVTTLIGRLLRAGGRSVVVCGNIGRPFCEVLHQVRPETTVVLEVSSFQLLRSPTLHPRVAVLLNLSENHLDRHPTFTEYLRAKARIFANQRPDDWAVLNAADAHVQQLGQEAHGRLVWFNHAGSGASSSTQNPDYEAAAAVARLFDVEEPVIAAALRAFGGLEHRRERVATVGGVTFINDSKSTTPASLRWALERTQAPTILIAGGRNKGCDFAPIRAVLARSTVTRLVLIGEAAAALRAAVGDVVPTEEAADLGAAVRRAFAAAVPGDTVLLSPGCASFDMFADYEDRGRRFKAQVQALAAAHVDEVHA